jgi:demethylmenaquinone methyltransferase/2-methoxy-6-polyprenyl-1,4-benzoquinol methylase
MIQEREPGLKGPPADDIKTLFSSVAHGYDLANDAMTFGLVRQWRRQLVKWSGAQPGDKILDCATGTGDLAIQFKKIVGSSGLVVGTDFCSKMLARAPTKAKIKGLDIRFELADVMQLPFGDDQFDVASIAYGIRNVADPKKALTEMARVVRPGGKVMVLETGDTPSGSLKWAFELYFQQVIPRVGGWITGQRYAYDYLNRSSRGFPSRARFQDLVMSTERFQGCECRVLLLGASFIYCATVL